MLSAGLGRVVEDGVLRWDKVRKEDEGWYRCTARSNAGTQHGQWVYLKVLGEYLLPSWWVGMFSSLARYVITFVWREWGDHLSDKLFPVVRGYSRWRVNVYKNWVTG